MNTSPLHAEASRSTPEKSTTGVPSMPQACADQREGTKTMTKNSDLQTSYSCACDAGGLCATRSSALFDIALRSHNAASGLLSCSEVFLSNIEGQPVHDVPESQERFMSGLANAMIILSHNVRSMAEESFEVFDAVGWKQDMEKSKRL